MSPASTPSGITVRIDKDAKLLHIAMPLKAWVPLPGAEADFHYVFPPKAEASLRALLYVMEEAILQAWPVDGSEGNPFFDL